MNRCHFVGLGALCSGYAYIYFDHSGAGLFGLGVSAIMLIAGEIIETVRDRLRT